MPTLPISASRPSTPSSPPTRPPSALERFLARRRSSTDHRRAKNSADRAAQDLEDPFGAETGHLDAPAVERRAVGLVAEERRHRTLVLVGVGAVDPLDRFV